MVPVIIFIVVLLLLIVMVLIGTLCRDSKNPYLRTMANAFDGDSGDDSWISAMILLPFFLLGVGISLVNKITKKLKVSRKLRK